MKCFYHIERDAVGVCKSCQRGLCPDCAIDLGKGIACPDRCEDDVRQLNQLVASGISQQPANAFLIARMRRTRLAAGLFYFAMGIGFIWWGLQRPFMHFIAVMGVLFVLYGLFALSQMPKASTVSTDANTKV
jgi:hypothetical protein